MRAQRAERTSRIQSLWSGYGEIVKLDLVGAVVTEVVAKRVDPPAVSPNGRADRSHARKLRSYAVEAHWYTHYASRCDEQCRVARCYGTRALSDGWLFVFEDLDAAGFPRRANAPTDREINAVLRWLAAFHATFLNTPPDGLWGQGTYWHLETRPDELARMNNQALRRAAPVLAQRLNACHYRTLLHGDAKLENFAFTAPPAGIAAAAVDFQYVGGGCGMKDVAYFFSSVFSPSQCERYADDALSYYFTQLSQELHARQPDVDARALETEWRTLYPVAWADFQRFLEGWAPGAYDNDPYAQRMLRLSLET